MKIYQQNICELDNLINNPLNIFVIQNLKYACVNVFSSNKDFKILFDKLGGSKVISKL